MKLLNKSSIKYKFLSFDELVINLDRLTRFKLPEEAYNKVFYSILLKNLIEPKYSRLEIEKLDFNYVSDIVFQIWNASVQNCSKEGYEQNKTANRALKMLIEYSFKNIDENTKKLIKTELNIAPILNKTDYNNAPLNLKFLIKLNETYKNTSINFEDLNKLRKKYALKFPIKKLIIVEGITEEILLPVFAAKSDYNFDEEGVYILGAGGKSKSPYLYMKLKEKLKIPIILLFDSDAKEIYDLLKKNLLKKDKIFIINNGEFEDILSLNLIKRALNNEYQPITPLIKNDLHLYNSMCKNIENFYQTRHLGEFKKSKLSKIIANNIKYETDITEEIKNIINFIRTI